MELGHRQKGLFLHQLTGMDPRMKLMEAGKVYGNTIVLSAHPMLLYNRSRGKRNDLLNAYFEFLSFLEKAEIEFAEQHTLLGNI